MGHPPLPPRALLPPRAETFRAARRIVLVLLAIVVLGSALPRPALASAARVVPTPGDLLLLRFEALEPSVGTVYTWSFGDGGSAQGELVLHGYAVPGRYLVTLETDDAGVVSTEVFWQLVGYEAASLDFEGGTLPPDWQVTGLEPSIDGAIEGSAGHEEPIVNPNPGPSCAMPVSVPPDPAELPQLRRRWLLSQLVDLGATPIDAGSKLDLLRAVGDGAARFGVRLVAQSTTWTVVGFAAEGDGSSSVATPARAVPSRALLVELEIQTGLDEGAGTSSLETGPGALGLRVSTWPEGVVLVSERIAEVDNAQLGVEAFDFGLFDAELQGFADDTGSASIKLDSFKVLTDRCLPPSPQGLLGFWDFEDALQPGLDLSGAGRHGVTRGTATTTDGRPVPGGGVERALLLDGAGHLEIPNLGADLVGATEVSVEAWVRVVSHPQMNLFRAQQPLAVRADGVSVANYVDGSGWNSVYADPVPPVGSWYHLAVVFDHGVTSVYVDGALVEQETFPFTELQGSSYGVWALGARVPGGSSGADQFFVGLVDDVKIYERALDAGEVESAAGRCLGP